MIAYCFVLALPTFFSLYSVRAPEKADILDNKYVFSLVGIFLTLFIGLRHEVGGDWIAYLDRITYLSELKPHEIGLWAPLYDFINLISIYFGTGIHFVNTFCALILSFGLLKFCSLLNIRV